MLIGFGSFGDTDVATKESCESAGNVWTGEMPYPCRSPEFVSGGASKSAATAIEMASEYPALYCSAVGGKYTWYGTCACPRGDGKCRSSVSLAKMNTLLGMEKPIAYAVFASVGLLGVGAAVAFYRRKAR